MSEFYCPIFKEDIVDAGGKVEAWRMLRCGDCSEKETCKGPLVKEEEGEGKKKIERKGRTPKAQAQVTDAIAIPLPDAAEEEPERDTACRAALLKLCGRSTKSEMSQRMADEFVGKFRTEITAARNKGVGWKPITKTAREHGYHFAWNTIERAFKRLEAKKEGQP